MLHYIQIIIKNLSITKTMRLLQYNIVLPVTLDELRLIENYIPLMLKLIILKNENENINFIQNKDFSNEEYVIIFVYKN